jgi:hypothetical protein
MTERFGQLAYTSFDAPGGSGGWQVKQTSGDLTGDEVHLLLGGVRTAFRPAEPLPPYPTPEQLDRAPRRLAYRRLDRERAAYWHSVPAGTDSTGRPGNVFAHSMIDRSVEGRPQRPIEWWRSAGWLSPFGQAAVAAATLPERPPWPAGVVTKDSVLRFALDPHTWRLATLFGLLDAVAAALAGGPPVVLGVGTADSAAQWIGTVSFLMAPGTAAALSFSTFDRADQLTVPSAPLLTAVPSGDLAEVPDGVVAIDESDTLWLGELDGTPHRTTRGQHIAVTPWSAMAQVVLLDHDAARSVLDDIDLYAGQSPEPCPHPAWPMAMSVLHRTELADAGAEARAVIAAHSPRGAAVGSLVSRTVAGVMRSALGETTADAWRSVQETPDGPAGDLAALTYLCRAVADDAWLDQEGPIPAARSRFRNVPVPRELGDAVGAALDVARAAGPERVVRLADLLLGSGVEDHRVAAALADAVVPHLKDPESGGALMRALDARIGAQTRLALAAALLRNTADSTEAVGADVLDWLAAGVSAPQPQDYWSMQPWDDAWTRAAVRGASTVLTAPTDPADRCAALWWLRVSGAPSFADVAASELWSPAELLAAVGDTPLPMVAATRTLLGAPGSPALDRLAAAVLDANTDPAAVACAVVRVVDPRTWVEQGYAATHQDAYTPLWDQAVDAAGDDGVHHDFALPLVVFAVIAAMSGRPYPRACTVLGADAALAAEAHAHLAALADVGTLNPVLPIAAAAHRWSLNGDEPPAGDPVGELLTGLAGHIVATRGAADADTVAATVAQMSGDMTAGGARRYRKVVTKVMARGPEPQSAGRKWWSH